MNSDGKETEFELLNYPPETDQLLPNEIIYAHVSAENNLLSSFRSPPLSEDQLETLQDKSGRIADEHLFRKCIFRGGIEKSLRQKLWPLLFGIFPCSFTTIEREAAFAQLEMRFIALQEKWRSWMASEFPTFDFSKPDNCILDDRPYHELPSSAPDKPVEIVAKHDVLLVEAKAFAQKFCCDKEKFLECLRYISKDVLRTERQCEIFRDAESPALLALRDILLTFCWIRPKIGYVQGMNDILARFILVFKNSQAAAFWCFVNFVDKVQSDFLAEGMVHKMELLQRCLADLDPDLYSFLCLNQSGDLVFCHKWLLVSFLREFQEEDGFKLFEILCSNHLELNSLQALKSRDDGLQAFQCTFGKNVNIVNANSLLSNVFEYRFDLFVCVAILMLNRNKIFQCDESSQIFSIITKLSGCLNLDQVLCEAEHLFHKFCHRSVLDYFVFS